MIPPELTPSLCQYLDTPSLVALSQTSSSWRDVFCERDFKQVLQHDRPWVQLENSNRCCWKQCALFEASRGFHKPCFRKYKSSFQHYSWPVKHDTPLPQDFYSLCKHPLLQTRVTFHDSGFSHGGEVIGDEVSVSLTQLPKQTMERQFVITNDTITSKYGISMRVDKDQLDMASFQSTPQVLVAMMVVIDEDIGQRQGDGMYLYIKYKNGAQTHEPDEIVFFEFQNGYSSEPTVVTVGACIFVQTEEEGAIHTHVVRHGKLELLDTMESSKAGLLCYDGQYWVVDSCCWSNRDSTPCSPVCQDPLVPQFAVFYDDYGFRSHVVDLKNKLTMNLRQVTRSKNGEIDQIAIPGLTNGHLEVYTYSKSYLADKFPNEESFQDFLRTLNNTPTSCFEKD